MFLSKFRRERHYYLQNLYESGDLLQNISYLDYRKQNWIQHINDLNYHGMKASRYLREIGITGHIEPNDQTEDLAEHNQVRKNEYNTIDNLLQFGENNGYSRYIEQYLYTAMRTYQERALNSINPLYWFMSFLNAPIELLHIDSAKTAARGFITFIWVGVSTIGFSLVTEWITNTWF